MKKKIPIIAGIVLFTLALSWTTLIIAVPVSVVDGVPYNTIELKKLNREREAAYNELLKETSSILTENIAGSLYCQLIKPIDRGNVLQTGSLISDANASIPFILENFYEKSLLIEEDISRQIASCVNNFTFPLQRKKQYTFTDFFPAMINVIDHDGKLYDEISFIILTEQITHYKELFTTLTENQIVETVKSFRGYHESIVEKPLLRSELYYYRSLSEYLSAICNTADNSSGHFLSLLESCIYNEASNIAINIAECSINFPEPVNVSAYNINGNYYNAKAYDEINGHILYIRENWTVHHNALISALVTAATLNIGTYIENGTYHPDSDLSGITGFIGYKYYKEIVNGSYINYLFDQCLISGSNLIITEVIPSWLGNMVLDIPLVAIDDRLYDSVAISHLQNSMREISPVLIDHAKIIFTHGVHSQTEIYISNINNYINWYYSYLASIGKTITNIIDFFSGDKSSDENFYLENFNRIIGKNADLNKLIENEMNDHYKKILHVFNEYIFLRGIFAVEKAVATRDSITAGEYINPYIEDMVNYFNRVYSMLRNQEGFDVQELTINDNETVKSTRTSVKLLTDISFFGHLLTDYIFLKVQQAVNSSALKMQILETILKTQKNKIAIINDPFNYFYEVLKTGSVIYADNYFVGYNTYQHYGVYIGEGKVIHFAPLEGQEISIENGIIHETTLEKFLNGRTLKIDKNIKAIFSETEIVERARSKLGKKGYDLFSNNCEHFARWCVTGEHVSYQIDNLPKKIDSTVLTIREGIDMVSKFIELFR